MGIFKRNKNLCVFFFINCLFIFINQGFYHRNFHQFKPSSSNLKDFLFAFKILKLQNE
jgi:hypothetical protein